MQLRSVIVTRHPFMDLSFPLYPTEGQQLASISPGDNPTPESVFNPKSCSLPSCLPLSSYAPVCNFWLPRFPSYKMLRIAAGESWCERVEIAPRMASRMSEHCIRRSSHTALLPPPLLLSIPTGPGIQQTVHCDC